jgi:hypothetical protein
MGFLAGIAGPVLGGATSIIGSALAKNKQQENPVNSNMIKQSYNEMLDAKETIQEAVGGLEAQNSFGKQNDVYNALAQIAQGMGPNPATALLNQQTGQNNAAQAALMAGQRGVSANPALASRQIAQMGAANQQNAIGQGAALQAQQSLGAIGQQGNMANQMASNLLQGAQQQGQLANAGMQTFLGANQAANDTNASIDRNNSSMMLKGLAGAGQAMQGMSGMMGGGAKPMADGGAVPEPEPMSLLDFLNSSPTPTSSPELMSRGSVVPGKARVKGDSVKNDVVPALLSPGEIVVPRSHAKDPKKAAAFARAVAARKHK